MYDCTAELIIDLNVAKSVGRQKFLSK